MTVMTAEPRPKSCLILTCMPLIRRAYEADCGHIYHKARDVGGDES